MKANGKQLSQGARDGKWEKSGATQEGRRPSYNDGNDKKRTVMRPHLPSEFL